MQRTAWLIVALASACLLWACANGSPDGGGMSAEVTTVATAEPTAAAAPSTAPPAGTGIVATIPVGAMPSGSLGVGADAVWVPNAGDGTVSRIDPRTNAVVATIAVGEPARTAAAVYRTQPHRNRADRPSG